MNRSRPCAVMAALVACLALLPASRALADEPTAAPAPPTASEIASATTLTAADLPAFTAAPWPAEERRQLARRAGWRCAGLSSPRQVQGFGASDEFRTEEPRFTSVLSGVWVMRSSEIAAHDARVMGSARVRRCLSRTGRGEIRRALPKTVRVTRLTVRPLAMAVPGAGGIRIRVGVVTRGYHTITVTDQRWVAQGRALILLLAGRVGPPLPTARAEGLLALLAERAATVQAS